MKIFLNKFKLTRVISNENNLGFIPTMGAIHEGHISLIKKSLSECNKTLVSIFVNKHQFNRKRDFKKYPRIKEKDISILKKTKVNYLYIPSNKQIYPNGRNNKIKISPFKKELCGKFRPGHFEAVVDVIDRFIKIINPKKIYFGEKDFQQLKIVKDFVKKNHKNIKIVGCKTIREMNGIAYSSRNSLLTQKDKAIASKITNFLFNQKNNLIKNKISIYKIKKKILYMGARKIDYLKIIDINKIIKPYKKNIKIRIFVAYYLGTTRLIDNF